VEKAPVAKARGVRALVVVVSIMEKVCSNTMATKRDLHATLTKAVAKEVAVVGTLNVILVVEGDLVTMAIFASIARRLDTRRITVGLSKSPRTVVPEVVMVPEVVTVTCIFTATSLLSLILLMVLAVCLHVL
jgi:hypothetical protein